MELRDVDATPIAWRELGEGDTVLFLHGLGMTRTGWDAVMQPLATDYRCVAWDMPGYGASVPLENFSLEAAADAAALALGEATEARSETHATDPILRVSRRTLRRTVSFVRRQLRRSSV